MVGIKYEDLAYTTRYDFASFGSNNGHNGTTGVAFYRNPDVVTDFASRSYVVLSLFLGPYSVLDKSTTDWLFFPTQCRASCGCLLACLTVIKRTTRGVKVIQRFPSVAIKSISKANLFRGKDCVSAYLRANN